MNHCFVKGLSGNPAGRTKGTGAVRLAPLTAAFNRSVAPYAEEILQRAVEKALHGDAQVLGGLVALIGSATGAAAAMRQGQQ